MSNQIAVMFLERSRVTTFTCIGLLGVLLPGCRLASAQITTNDTSGLPPRRQILDRYVEAIGGRERWLKLKSVHLTGRFESVELGFSGPLELWSVVPNTRLVQIDLERYGRVLQGFDGRPAGSSNRSKIWCFSMVARWIEHARSQIFQANHRTDRASRI
ncbi:hypothetical protein GC207_15800 [bacterium]|nr:hypothetical protein [bacterium]